MLNNIKEGRLSELLWIHKHRSISPAWHGAEAMCDEFKEMYPLMDEVICDDDNSSALYPVGFHAGMMYMANCLDEIINAKGSITPIAAQKSGGICTATRAAAGNQVQLVLRESTHDGPS